MNDNAKKWVAALRSGEYKQGKGYLRSKEGFCCLGVACDIYAKEKGGDWGDWESNEEGTFQTFWTASDGDKSTTALPGRVQRWLGFVTDGGRYVKPDQSALSWYLINDNDGMNGEGAKTFSEIADIIESEPEGLFVK